MMGTNNCHIKVEQATTNDSDELRTMSSVSSSFEKTDKMFLEFGEDLNNTMGESSSVGDNSGDVHSHLNSWSWSDTFTPMVPGMEKPISPHDCFFMFDFNDQAMNEFVEHQMLTSFKEFKGDCHKHFKKYSDLEEARANPLHILVGRMEDWHFLCDYYMSRSFLMSLYILATRQTQPYNHRIGSKSFLQRQHELAEQQDESIDHVELFKKTHIQAGMFVLQAAENVHLSRQPGYSKGLGWRSKPKSRKTVSAGNSSTLCSQSTIEPQLRVELDEVKRAIEE
ncbi:CACTA en-spm transposon protein [Cucumis melo var. makuwa]|uniref:CACTA en-spm transposon protein n=1 Tax=Cucumis melo var. makuwa TaxID=1194695 RepID=A0A5D3CU21_CUCMM|nr:CACTA en-spm transposon protein [Cucumis melo var. makuwa]